MTTPERHEKVYELFVNARKLDDAALVAYLDKACADDPSLREEVEALLAQDSEMSSFLEQPSAPTPLGSAGPDTISSAGKPPAAESRASDALAGIIIEGYEILRELHRGGQGVVFQAVQKSTKRKVAIKVLREGPYASKSAKKRFEREIELVAQLKHPNIIAIFDSGTTAGGWQYCTMDYVRGTQLNHHIRENKLTLEETLSLFKQVCDAVQYAHHKGVIHRDLKPSNILVDSEGNAKVLDFGLAKQMIGPVQTVVSMTQEIIGTLPYMSPEQAKGNPDHIDTRTDIYALGVILYEILTGHYPYPVAGQMADVLKHIAETPPTPPSSRWTPESGVTKRSSKHLRPGKCPIDDELQTVILKTLAKERKRRYQSAGALAEEISHYLANEPIDAKRDSAFYVLSKTLRRYRVRIAAVTAFALIIVALVVVVRYAAETATLRDAIAKLQLDYKAQQRIIRASARRGAPMLAEAELDDAADGLAELRQLKLALGRQKLALMHRQGQATTLAAFTTSENHQGAVEYLNEQLGDTPDDAYLTAYRGYARVMQYLKTGDTASLEPARRDYQRCMVLDSAYAAIAHDGIGTTYHLQARLPQSGAYYKSAIDEYSRAISIQPDFLRAYSNRGHVYFDEHRDALAIADYAAAVSAGFERLAESVPDAERTYCNFGTALRRLGESEEAATQYRQAVIAAPEDVYYDVALALALLDVGRTAEADACLEVAKGKTKPGTWDEKFVRCVSLDLSPEQLVDEADKPNEKCEAPYYAGEAFMRRGEHERAKSEFADCLEECSSNGLTSFNEYRWAEWRLDQARLSKEAD